MDLEDLKTNWEAFGRTIPMRSILWRQAPWDVDEFFATGEEWVASSMAQLADLGIHPRGRALDFGCGMGRLAQALAGRLDSVVGVDIAESMVELARKHNAHGDRCRYLVNGSDDLSQFADGSFDFVYTMIVLQHVGADRAAGFIAEFMRVLAPGGFAMFQLPAALIPIEHLAPEGMRATIDLAEPVPEGSRPVEAGISVTLAIRVANISGLSWEPEHRLHVCGRWLHARSLALVNDQGPYQRIPEAVPGGSSFEVEVEAGVPAADGDYFLDIDIVQPTVSLFGPHGSQVLRLAFSVSGGLMPGADSPTVGEGEATAHMEMHGVPRERVEHVVVDAGGRLVAAIADGAAGADWESYVYVAAKPAPVPPAGSPVPRRTRRTLFRRSRTL
ncbi:MAG TPA: class I SAM-dependent methyltransferase [Acidimicrobiales bacterium]|nr:class I SAM-dependent methyltransferase [Acidimicrobiales bacterium]